jgi:hypothetical protein
MLSTLKCWAKKFLKVDDLVINPVDKKRVIRLTDKIRKPIFFFTFIYAHNEYIFTTLEKKKCIMCKMSVFLTEAIIIKRINFGEADRILTVVTPFKGKIKIIAKGVRKITSRRGGNVELLNKVKLHIFQGTGMPILTEAESISTYPLIKNDLMLSSYGSHIMELAERLLPEEQANPQAYQLLVSILELLELNPRQIFIRAFEIKLLSALGYWNLNQVEVDGELKAILDKLQKESWDDIGKISINKNQAMELEKIVRYYIEKILESSLKSIRIIRRIKQNG